MQISKYKYAKILVRRKRFKDRISSPFLSSDLFRNLADISIHTESDFAFASNHLDEKSIVFCTSEFVSFFLNSLSSSQKGKILIAGDSDFDFTVKLNSKSHNFTRVYLQNSQISDNKRIFTLPIGVENIRLGGEIGLPKNLQSRLPWTDRKRMVLNGPYSISDTGRKSLLDCQIYSHKYFTNITDILSPRRYAELVGQHRFVVCPRGNGKDTHRFWEALYRGSIPIVLNDNWSASLRIYGLPFLEVENFDPETIVESVNEVMSKSSFDNYSPATTDSLWMDYWANLFLK